MGIAGDMVRAFIPTRKALQFPASPFNIVRYLPGERDYTRDVGDGSSSSLVTAILLWVMRTFPEAPLYVERRGEVVPNHPLTSLVARPNKGYAGLNLWMATVLSYVLDGNAYWLKVRSQAGRVAELWYVPHWMMTPTYPADGSEYITGYEYNPLGRKVNLPREDVVHIRFGIDPQNTRRGLSPLKGLLREVYTDEEAARYSAAMLRNAGVPPLVISPAGDGMMTAEEAEAAKALLMEKTTGERRGEPLIMQAATNVQQFGFSPGELALTDLRRIPEERIAAVFGIPAMVVGFGAGLSRSTFSNYAESREAAYEGNIIPTQRVFASELDLQLLPDFDRDPTARTAFDLDEIRILQEDANALHERVARDVQAGILSVAEAQRILGYPVDETQRVYLRPVNTVDVPATATKARMVPPHPTNGKAAAPPQEAVRFQARLQRIAGARIEAMTRALEAVFDDLGEDAARAYLAGKQDPDAESDRIIEELGITSAVLAPIYAHHYDAAARETAAALVETYSVSAEVAVMLPDAVAQAVTAAGGRRVGLVDLTQETRDAIFRALTEAEQQGLGVVPAGRRIRESVPAGRFAGMGLERGRRYRADTIARTEMAHATRISAAQAGISAGFEQYIAFDNRIGYDDPECTARDGTVYSVDEMMREIANEHPRGTLSFSPLPGSQKQRPLPEMRCSGCNRLLAKDVVGARIQCPKCKRMNVGGVGVGNGSV